MTTSRWSQRCTLAALCTVSLIKGADLELLPSSFRAMEIDLQLRPEDLGRLALLQGVAFAAAGPLWGNLIDSGVSRKYLIMCGTAGWGILTTMLGFVSNLAMISVLRFMNGMALAMIMPVAQSFVADMCATSERGQVFGLLYLLGNVGQLLTCLFVTPISDAEVVGVRGWRVALIVIGVLSCGVAAAVPVMIEEPPREWRPERLGPMHEFRKLSHFLAIPSFGVIILQGVFGTIPGAAMSFLTMYLQYTGLSDQMCAMVKAIGIMGDGLGGMMGGLIGDALHGWSPRYGRALTAQISVVLSVPVVYILFSAVPVAPYLAYFYATLLALHGLLGCWAAPGCLNPVMCEIVPTSSLASAYSWEAAFAFCSGNFLGPTLVGTFTDLLGYRANTIPVALMPEELRQMNLAALGKALCIFSTVPYFLCAICFSLLYFTYHVDVLRHKKRSEAGGYGASESAAIQAAA